jgi:exodeoxyribonuclease V beta subunit
MTTGFDLALELSRYRLAVIQASAGTGKTYTLEHLVVELIATQKVPIEKILAVTFTDKAALELKSRVRKKLEESVAAGGGSERRRAIERALTGFESASISTIHSFCQRILVENAFLHRRLFEQEAVDGDTAFREAFRETLRRDLAPDPLFAALLHALRRNRVSTKDFEDLLVECWNQRALTMEPDATEEDVRRELPASGLEDPHAAASTLADWPNAKAAAVQIALPRVLVTLRQQKAEAGVFDFNDMLDLVKESLEGPFGENLTQVLRERYDAVLVDEFQDTDPVQWKILHQLFFESKTHRLYVIGDPKQAIYGFRAADVATYRKAVDEITETEGSRIQSLEQNFRSSPLMIEAFNSLFDGFFSPPEPARVTCGKENLALCAPDGSVAEPVVILEPALGQDKLKAGPVKATLAAVIANEIRALVDGGFSLKGPDERPLAWSDIYILAQKKSELELASRALHERGIPFVFFKKEGLFQTSEAKSVRDLLFAIADPEDRRKRSAALLTPFFGESLQSLLDQPEIVDSERLIEKLDSWSRLAANRDFAVLFARLLSETRLSCRELFFAPTGQALANYRQLFEFLLGELSRNPAGLDSLALSLASYAQELRKPPGRDADTLNLPSTPEAVRLSTIHKSKGLEATVVFVFGGFTVNNTRSFRLIRPWPERTIYIGTPPKTSAERQEADRLEREEHQRLMYVALTRAKVRLYLPYFPETLVSAGKGKTRTEKSFPKLEGPYGVLNDRFVEFDRKGALPARLFCRKTVDYENPLASPDPPSMEKLATWDPLIEPVASAEGGTLRDLCFRQRGFTVTSYTGLKAATGRMELLRAGQDIPRPVLSAPSTKAGEVLEPGGIAFGIALHEILEKLPLDVLRDVSPEEWFEREDVKRIVARAAEGSGIAGETAVEKLALLAKVAVTTPLVAGSERIGPLVSVPVLLRETAFHFPIPESSHPPLSSVLGIDRFEIERGLLKGFIDVLFEHAGKTYLLDWKSDWLPSYTPEALKDHVQQRYSLQLRIYSLALLRMLGAGDEASFEKGFGGFLFAFPRAMDPASEDGAGLVFSRPSWPEIEAWEETFRRERETSWLREEP